MRLASRLTVAEPLPMAVPKFAASKAPLGTLPPCQSLDVAQLPLPQPIQVAAAPTFRLRLVVLTEKL